MKNNKFFIKSLILIFFLGLLGLWSGCATSPDSEDDYWQAKPTDDYYTYRTPTPSRSTRNHRTPLEEKEIGEDGKKSFWSRIFGRGEKKKENENTPSYNRQNSPIRSTKPLTVYRLRPGDPIFISIQGIPTATMIEDVIDEYGNVNLPLVGSVRAEGLTSAELERKIERIYIHDKKIYKHVTISIINPTKSYTIRGEVRGPGRYPLSGGRVTILQAIAAAGGFTEFANPKKIKITRTGQTIKVNFKEIEKYPERDIIIKPDDTIRVPGSIF